MNLKGLIYSLMAPWFFGISLRRLRLLERHLLTPSTRLAIPFIFRGVGHFKSIRPMQSQVEFGQLYDRVCSMQPRTIMEIGTCHGGTLYLWCQAAHPEANVLSLDLPDGEFGGGYKACRAPFYRAFSKPAQKLCLIRADSHSAATVEQISSLLGDRPIDLLFIDGDHTYNGVKQDYELYSRFVAPNGLIAIHDILQRSTDSRIEVWRFWDEIKRRNDKVQEIIDNTRDGRAIGIGLIQTRP